MGYEAPYISQFRAILKGSEIDRSKFRFKDRDLNFSRWRNPKGSQNIPVLANALYADDESEKWFERYLRHNLENWFLDYEGPVSRQKTPWVVAALAYYYHLTSKPVQGWIKHFMDHLFVFLSLMTIQDTRVDYRDGLSIICAGPRSPQSLWLDHPLNSMISYVLNPTASRNKHEGQGDYWSSGIFRHFNGRELISKEVRDLMSMIVYSPSLLDKEEANTIRNYLVNIRLKMGESYVIMRYKHGLFSAYPENMNVHSQPIQIAKASQTFPEDGTTGKLKWNYLLFPILSPNTKASLGGDIMISRHPSYTEIRALYPGLPKLVFSVPRSDALLYTVLMNQHDFWFTLGDLT